MGVTVENETYLAQNRLSLLPPPPSRMYPPAGPSSHTQAAFPEVCIWHQPKSYNHFIKKTKPTPAPHVHRHCQETLGL